MRRHQLRSSIHLSRVYECPRNHWQIWLIWFLKRHTKCYFIFHIISALKFFLIFFFRVSTSKSKAFRILVETLLKNSNYDYCDFAAILIFTESYNLWSFSFDMIGRFYKFLIHTQLCFMQIADNFGNLKRW